MAETRLIFCWSPGRCGTGYLAKMLATIPSVTVRHEPPPRFRPTLADKSAFWALKKLPAIMALRADVYAETAHPFREYLPSLLSLGMMPDIVQIKRDHRDVALSFWRRRSVPGRTKRGREFLCVPTFDGWQRMTAYQLCYWHSREVERWGAEMRVSVDNWIVVGFDELVNGDGFCAVVRELGLTLNRRAWEARRHWRVNGNPENYYQAFPDGDLDEQEREIDRLMDG